MIYASLAILGGLGVTFGVGLAVASRVLHVEIDPRIEQVGEVLPGANCGGCGYAGCSAYAEAIVNEARKRGMAGATVLRGFLGFGAHSRIHTSKVLRLSEDLPVVIEIVDRKDRMDAFLPELDSMITEGLVTLEPVRVIAYRHGTQPDGEPSR